MPELSEHMYCSEQICIPPTFPYLLRQYAKAAIRSQPTDLLRWSSAYFRCLALNLPPPVKPRLEYPIPRDHCGVTPGWLRALLQQLGGGQTVTFKILWDRWTGACLKHETLIQILCLAGFTDPYAIPWLRFIAMCAGHLTDNLTQTMILICEILTEEPEGGSAMITVETFNDLYQFLAEIDASEPQTLKNMYFTDSLLSLYQKTEEAAEVEVVERVTGPEEESVTPEESLEEDRSAEAVREDESIVSCPDIAADPLPSQENIEIHGESDVTIREVAVGAYITQIHTEDEGEAEYDGEEPQEIEPKERVDSFFEQQDSAAGSEVSMPINAILTVRSDEAVAEKQSLEAGENLSSEAEEKEALETEEKQSFGPEEKIEEESQQLPAQTDDEKTSELELPKQEKSAEGSVIKESESVETVQEDTDFIKREVEDEVVQPSTEIVEDENRALELDLEKLKEMQEIAGEEGEEESVEPELPPYSTSIEELFDKYAVPQPSLDDLSKMSASQTGLEATSMEAVEKEKVYEDVYVDAVPGIGPIVPAHLIKVVVEYMNEVAAEQHGMVMPRNIRHYRCPPLEVIN